jgi:D-glycero-alpha-D-manno-heptose-7-phosphate kinase
MIIARTPLRISLGGGGSDLPSYYRPHGPGYLVAAAIDKYVYVAVHKNFDYRYLLKYSEIENVSERVHVRHPMIRAALEYFKIDPGVEITSIADIPGGTGLGSSGSYAVGLLMALALWSGVQITQERAAEIACHLEIDVLGEPVGKQDQYIAAFGGITAFEFHSDETVITRRLNISSSNLRDLEASFMLFYTGVRRSASEELRSVNAATSTTSRVVENLQEVVESGRRAVEALEAGQVEEYGAMLTEQWKLKFARQPSKLHEGIDDLVELGIREGAFGGKLVGAGGGGFLLFSTADRRRLRRVMEQRGLIEVPINFDFTGTSLVGDWR